MRSRLLCLRLYHFPRRGQIPFHTLRAVSARLAAGTCPLIRPEGFSRTLRVWFHDWVAFFAETYHLSGRRQGRDRSRRVVVSAPTALA